MLSHWDCVDITYGTSGVLIFVAYKKYLFMMGINNQKEKWAEEIRFNSQICNRNIRKDGLIIVGEGIVVKIISNIYWEFMPVTILIYIV